MSSKLDNSRQQNLSRNGNQKLSNSQDEKDQKDEVVQPVRMSRKGVAASNDSLNYSMSSDGSSRHRVSTPYHPGQVLIDIDRPESRAINTAPEFFKHQGLVIRESESLTSENTKVYIDPGAIRHET